MPISGDYDCVDSDSLQVTMPFSKAISNNRLRLIDRN